MSGSLWTVYLIYQFCVPLSPLSPRRVILYTRLFFSCSFPDVFSSFAQRGQSFCRAVPPMQLRHRAQSAQKQTMFRLIFGGHLVYRFFFSGRTPPPALAAAFWGRSEGGLFAESAVLPFFSACKCLPEALPPLDSPPELRPPPLYTARPICWLTFPLGSDTISIKHRKGRPAPWPSS